MISAWVARVCLPGVVLASILIPIVGSPRAFAQSNPTCTVPNTTLAFGDVTSDLLANQNSDATGTINYSCTGTANDQRMPRA
jgi:hypothetical protein